MKRVELIQRAGGLYLVYGEHHILIKGGRNSKLPKCPCTLSSIIIRAIGDIVSIFMPLEEGGWHTCTVTRMGKAFFLDYGWVKEVPV